jgi:hypothetical protein
MPTPPMMSSAEVPTTAGTEKREPKLCMPT